MKNERIVAVCLDELDFYTRKLKRLGMVDFNDPNQTHGLGIIQGKIEELEKLIRIFKDHKKAKDSE